MTAIAGNGTEKIQTSTGFKLHEVWGHFQPIDPVIPKRIVTCSKLPRDQSLLLETSYSFSHPEKLRVSQPVSVCLSRLRKHFYQLKPNLSLMGRRMVTRSDAFPNDPLPVTGAPSRFTEEFEMEFQACFCPCHFPADDSTHPGPPSTLRNGLHEFLLQLLTDVPFFLPVRKQTRRVRRPVQHCT